MEETQEQFEVIDWHQDRVERAEIWIAKAIAAYRPVLSPRLRGASFEEFRPEIKNEALSVLSSDSKSMYTWGGVGAGKTWLAVATALYQWDKDVEEARLRFMERVRKNEVPRCGIDDPSYGWSDLRSPLNPQLYNVPWLIDKLKSEFGKEEQTNMVELASYSGIIIFDDIGVGNMTPWVQEQIYLFVNERYDQLLPTFYTSNLSPDALGQVVGERISSRIIGSCEIIGLKHEDRRKPKKI